MLRRLLILIAPALILFGPAQASEKKSSGPAGQYVDLQPVAMPIIVNGVLRNYVFVAIRINIAPRADIQKMREKEPFFRDALVRDAHRAPFVVPTDYEKVDEARVTATMAREAAAIAGPGAIQSVVVISQTPQRRVAPPKPPAATHP
jgi:hypothetical protein